MKAINLKYRKEQKMKISVFIATPIAAFPSEKEYEKFRTKLKILSEKMSEKVDVFSAALTVPSFSAYSSPALSADQDFNNIKNSTHFILIYPQAVPTSALVELGYALALKKKILILASSRENLPYMTRELDDVYSNVQISCLYPDWDDIENVIASFLVLE